MPDLHYALGNLYFQARELDKAEREFRAELQIAPENYLASWKLGSVYLTRRQYDQAFLFLRKAIQQKPDLGQAHRDLGRDLIQTGDYQGAVVELKEVAQVAPNEPTTHYLLAQAYRKLGRKEEQNAEIAEFEKLRNAEQQRNKRPDILSSKTETQDDLSDNASAPE